MIDIRDHGGIFGGGTKLPNVLFANKNVDESYMSNFFQMDKNGDVFVATRGQYSTEYIFYHYDKNNVLIKSRAEKFGTKKVCGFFKDYFVATENRTISFYTHNETLIKQVTVNSRSTILNSACMFNENIVYIDQDGLTNYIVFVNSVGAEISRHTILGNEVPVSYKLSLNYYGFPFGLSFFSTTSDAFNIVPVTMDLITSLSTIKRTIGIGKGNFHNEIIGLKIALTYFYKP